MTDRQSEGRTDKQTRRQMGREAHTNKHTGGENGIRLWKTMENNYK